MHWVSSHTAVGGLELEVQGREGGRKGLRVRGREEKARTMHDEFVCAGNMNGHENSHEWRA